MDITQVIQDLVQEKGLDRDKVIDVVCQGILGAYKKKFRGQQVEVDFDRKTNQMEVYIVKKVVDKVEDPAREISLRQAKLIDPESKIGFKVRVPFEGKIGRVEIVAAKNVIARGIKALEEEAVFREFKGKQGSLVSGIVHKKERRGFAVNLGDVVALIPNSCLIPGENVRVGFTIRALLKEVAETSRGGYQLILDRASPEFLKKLLEAEVPEVFEGIVEVKRIERVPGYKSKVVVDCPGREVDPVGTCVGVGGSRIKPILRELGGVEKIDLIAWTENLEELVKESLKPAQVDKVEISVEGDVATVWLAEDQRSAAIGRMGQNIALASKISGVQINLYRPDDTGGGVFDSVASSSDDRDGKEGT